jgi:hypothetical protein
MVLRRIFGPKRDEILGGWKLHNLYSLPNAIRMIKSMMIRWVRHVARMRIKRNAYKVLVGKPEGMRPLGIPRRRFGG